MTLVSHFNGKQEISFRNTVMQQFTTQAAEELMPDVRVRASKNDFEIKKKLVTGHSFENDNIESE